MNHSGRSHRKWAFRRALLVGVTAASVLVTVGLSSAAPPSEPVQLAGFCILGHHHAKGCRGGSLVKSEPSEPCDYLAVRPGPDVRRSEAAPSYALVGCGEPLDSPREPQELVQDGVELKEGEANSESFPMPGRLANPEEMPPLPWP